MTLQEHRIPTTLTDAQLIHCCADNKQDAACWAEFTKRYQALLTRSSSKAYRRFTHGGFPPRWRVAEFVQEVYLRLLRNDCDLMRRLRSDSAPAAMAYLANIAANTVGDLMREELAQKRFTDTTSLDSARNELTTRRAKEFPIPEGLADEDLVRLLALSSSAENIRRDVMIFLLHVRAGMTAQEIAKADFVRLQPASVMSILIRTRNRLKKALEKAA